MATSATNHNLPGQIVGCVPRLGKLYYLPPLLSGLHSWPRDGHLVTAGLSRCPAQDFSLWSQRAQVSVCLLLEKYEIRAINNLPTLQAHH